MQQLTGSLQGNSVQQLTSNLQGNNVQQLGGSLQGNPVQQLTGNLAGGAIQQLTAGTLQHIATSQGTIFAAANSLQQLSPANLQQQISPVNLQHLNSAGNSLQQQHLNSSAAAGASNSIIQQLNPAQLDSLTSEAARHHGIGE